MEQTYFSLLLPLKPGHYIWKKHEGYEKWRGGGRPVRDLNSLCFLSPYISWTGGCFHLFICFRCINNCLLKHGFIMAALHFLWTNSVICVILRLALAMCKHEIIELTSKSKHTFKFRILLYYNGGTSVTLTLEKK